MSSPRLSIIPAGAVTDRSLEPRDLQVLCLLGRHTDKAGWCIRSQVKMAREIACSRGSLQNSLDRLSEAHWIEMKRLDVEVEAAGKQPSRSYAYRVLLDRDDYAFENATRDAEGETDESYAENASDEGGCQPVGTPTVPTDQHPGANACDGTGANTYVGTKNAPLERPLLERERDARARDLKDRKIKFLNAFEARWPTAAADDRQRTAYAAEALSEPEESEALAGIAPFLENLKRQKRTAVPAGWKYLEQRRWTLLEAQKAAGVASMSVFPADSPEAKAVTILHELASRMTALRSIWRQPDGSIKFPKPMTPQLLALSQAPPISDWQPLNHQQAGSWEEMLRHFFEPGIARKHLKEGDLAPGPWPPTADGKPWPWPPAAIEAAATGPPEAGLSDQELADFK